MGGLAGHMMHPMDDMDLTMGQLKDMIYKSLTGNIRFKEKLDGINIHFFKYHGKLRMARNGMDLQVGGFTDEGVPSRIRTNTVHAYFQEAYRWFLGRVDLRFMEEFTETGITYNAEIMADHINTIFYYLPISCFIHHRTHWNMTTGEVIGMDDELGGLSSLTGPVLTWRPSNTPYIHGFMQLLDTIGSEVTMKGYLTERLYSLLNQDPYYKGRISKGVAGDILGYLLHLDGHLSLRELREEVEVGLDVLLSNKSSWIRRVKAPMDGLMISVGTEVLGSVGGYLNENYPDSINLLADTIRHANPMGDEVFMTRWAAGGYRVPALEGVVFEYNGKPYKWTGTFAPINRLLGKEKYLLLGKK